MSMNNDTDDCKNNRTNGCGNISYNSSVEKIKQQAAELYNEKEYDSALGTYTLLIGLCPNEAIFYSNRAACYMMLGDYVKALGDAKKSVELNPMFIKGHCRVIKCAILLHRRLDIEISVAKLRTIDPNNEVLQYQEQKMRELSVHQQNEFDANVSKDYVKALQHIEKYLEICPQFLDYKVKKAECLVNLRRFSEAETLCREILKDDPNNSDIHYVLGRCLHETDIETSMHHFRKAFRLDPDSGKDRQFYEAGKTFLEKKMKANMAYKSRNFSQAYNLYYNLMLECIKNSGMLITLFFNMAQASYKLGNLDRCRQECTSVLNLNPNHLKALLRRAQCFMDQKEPLKAIEDLEKASGIESSAEVFRMLQAARKLSEASKNDFYTILGVVRGASMEMITKAYKELTRVHHPDRHANATNEEKIYHEMKCKEITRAYRLVMDQKPAKESNNTNGTQGTNSAPKSSTKGFNSDLNNNNGKPSSAGKNPNFTGPQSSARGSNTHKGQQNPSGGANNNFYGSQSSAGGAHTHNGQQHQSGGTSTNFTGPPFSSGGFNHQNGQQYPSGATGPQWSAGGFNNYEGQQPSAGGTGYSFTAPQGTAGFSHLNGQQFPSGGANTNFTGPQPSTGFSHFNGQQFPTGSFNGSANGQQFQPWINGYVYSSGVPLGNPSVQQFPGGPHSHCNQQPPPPGAFNNVWNVPLSSFNLQQPPRTVNNNWNGPQSSTTTYNSEENHKQQFPSENWNQGDNDNWDEEDDSKFGKYVHQKQQPRRRKNRYRPYLKRKNQRYCHFCDWFIRDKNKCCPHCGYDP